MTYLAIQNYYQHEYKYEEEPTNSNSPAAPSSDSTNDTNSLQFIFKNKLN